MTRIENTNCPEHMDMMSKLSALQNDIHWALKIGKWTLGCVGAAIPFIIAFVVYIHLNLADIQKDMAVLKTAFKTHDKLNPGGKITDGN